MKTLMQLLVTLARGIMKKLSQGKMIDTILSKRKALGLTQASLSEKTGINRVMIGRIENKEYMPSIDQIERLGEVLGFEVTDLFVSEEALKRTKPNKRYNIAVAGTGYVGLSMATLLSQHNHVVAVDIVSKKVDMINKRISPIQDEYIEKYFKEKDLDLRATLDADSAYRDAEFVIIAAPTNYDSKRNFFDCSSVEDVIERVLRVNPKATIIIKSTVPV